MPSPKEVVVKLASGYPGAEKAVLFGDHDVYRVNKKVYVWYGDTENGGFYLSVKLKDSQAMALMLPFVKPAEYGMAKWGWVEANFPKGKFQPEIVRQWIEESYRHTAPKKLLKQLDGDVAQTQTPAPAKKKKPAKKPAARAERSR